MRESYVEPSLPIQQTLTVHSYSGDLTFTFQNELQIRIPNHQLVLPDITIDTSGNTNYNYSVREIMLNSDQQINANDMPFLGATFLTSAYLSVNHDYGSFSLWQANPTTDEKLIGIGPNGNGCQETANATSSTSPIATASQSSQPQPHPSPHNFRWRNRRYRGRCSGCRRLSRRLYIYEIEKEEPSTTNRSYECGLPHGKAIGRAARAEHRVV